MSDYEVVADWYESRMCDAAMPRVHELLRTIVRDISWLVVSDQLAEHEVCDTLFQVFGALKRIFHLLCPFLDEAQLDAFRLCLEGIGRELDNRAAALEAEKQDE